LVVEAAIGFRDAGKRKKPPAVPSFHGMRLIFRKSPSVIRKEIQLNNIQWKK